MMKLNATTTYSWIHHQKNIEINLMVIAQWLTFMATLATLATQGRLIQYELAPDDDRQPERLLYLSPALWAWIDGTLTYVDVTNWPKQPDEPTLPIEQVDGLFERFVVGEPLTYGNVNWAKPESRGVWKFRTSDVRIFGCFHRPRQFVAVCGGLATTIKQRKEYPKYRDTTLQFIDALDLDGPKIDHTRNLHALL